MKKRLIGIAVGLVAIVASAIIFYVVFAYNELLASFLWIAIVVASIDVIFLFIKHSNKIKRNWKIVFIISTIALGGGINQFIQTKSIATALLTGVIATVTALGYYISYILPERFFGQH